MGDEATVYIRGCLAGYVGRVHVTRHLPLRMENAHALFCILL